MKAEARARKILKVGGSYLVSLPREFIEKNQLKAGDSIGLVCDSILIIAVPKPVEGKGDD
jgi:antitoxin component of MazEF toxin-antitoxin module